MSAARRRVWSEAEYFAAERLAEGKSEFYRGQPYAMAGASREHNRVKENLGGELHARLKQGPCQSFSSDQRIRVREARLVAYPDIVVVCGPPEYDADDRDTLANPTLIVEVLSPSTEAFDRGGKFHAYRQLPSLQEYVLVSQDRPLCERYRRLPDGGWELRTFAGLEVVLELSSLGLAVPMAEIYARVEGLAAEATE